MRVSTPAAPPPPAPVSAGESMRSYMESVSDPALQGRILAAEQQFRPEYAALNLADLNSYLLGANGQLGALDLQDLAARQSAQTGADALSLQREADIADVEQFGARAAAAFRTANPGLSGAISRAEGLLGQSGTAGDFAAYVRNNPDLLRNWQENTSRNTGMSIEEYGRQHYEGAGRAEGRSLPQTSTGAFREFESNVLFQNDRPLRTGTAAVMGQPDSITQGVLGQNLYDQAVSANGLGRVGGILGQRAESLAQSTGRLTPDELRSLQQATREAYASRGVEMGSGAISAEALSRLTNERARMQEDVALAAQLNAANQAELAANRGFQQSVYGQDLARQDSNRGAGIQVGALNQAAQNQMALANLNAALGQDQQRIANLGVLGQFRQGQTGADRGYALQLAALQQAIAGDPFQAILGRPSQALSAAQFQQQYAGGLAAGMQGPQLFDPNAGVNLALQNNANLANYNASIYGARAASEGAQRGAITGAIGNIFGSLLGARPGGGG